MPLLLTVIIPYAQIGDPRHVLRSIAAQTLASDLFETLVVHEGPLSDAVATASRSLNVRFIEWQRPASFRGHSAGRLRNLGARNARGERLVFIDSDCIASPQNLFLHHSLGGSGSKVVICGGLAELPANMPLPQATSGVYRTSRRSAVRDFRLRQNSTPLRSGRWDEFYSANGSVPRRLFIEVGGFDEEGYRCHDIDLGYRLAEAGARFVFAADCEVVHVEHPRVAASRHEQAAGWQHLANKRPALRRSARAHIANALDTWRQIVALSERLFVSTTGGLPGRRFGTTWVVPLGTPEERVVHSISGIPFFRRVASGATEYYLRLHRSCWDYSIVVPTSGPPAITVVVPAFNAAATIERALASVFAQTQQSFELLVIDDGSTDGTAAVASRFFCDSRLRVVTLESNRGLAHALNVAIDIVASPLLLHLDADDWLAPQALQRMSEEIGFAPAFSAAYCDAVVHMPGGETQRTHGTKPTERRHFFECRSPQVARTYWRDLLSKIGGWSTSDPFEGRYFEDRLMLARMSEHGPVKHVSEALYHIAGSPRSLSQQRSAAVAKFIIVSREAATDKMSVETRVKPGALACRWVPRRKAVVRPWSVVIPCHDRADLLRYSLRTWLASDWHRSAGEIIVIDDGSPEPLERTIGSLDPRIRFLRSANRRGAAASRNWGARVARHEWLFFADGDHLVPPDVLAVHAWYHDRGGERSIVVGGTFGARVLTSANAATLRPQWRRRLLDLAWHSDSFEEVATKVAIGGEFRPPSHSGNGGNLWDEAQRRSFYEPWLSGWATPMLDGGYDLTSRKHAWLRLAGNNLSMTRWTFIEAGRFDSRMQVFEDWDFGLRLLASGGRILTAADAEPLHQLHAQDAFRVTDEWQAARRFARKHPNAIAAIRRNAKASVPPGGDRLLQLLASDAPRSDELRSESATSHAVNLNSALTFDDGPHPVTTPAVLDILQDLGALATFFVNGCQVERYPDLVRRIAAEGHELGVHGWSHERPTQLSPARLERSLNRTAEAIENTTGRRPQLARAPYGDFTDAFRHAAEAKGLHCAGWDVSSHDWSAAHSKAVIREVALAGVRGKVILLHDGSTAPEVLVSAVAWIVAACRTGGGHLVTLSELRRHGGR